jgi:photosystem II stability/assembly factor-like uncharacterized protein
MLSTDDAFAVGEAGTIVRLEGGVWVDRSITNVIEALHSVWGQSASNVYVVGAQSRVLNWDGIKWKIVTVDAANIHTFHGVHGTAANDVYIATEYFSPSRSQGPGVAPMHAGGYIFRWNGTSWLPVYQDPGHDILAVWAASRGRAFACGDAYSLLTGIDGTWSRVFDLEDLPFFITAVYGNSANNVFVVGDNGMLARYSR